MELAKELQELEEGLLRSEARRDADRLDAILCKEFREYGASGRVFTKAEIVALLQAEEPARLSLSEFHCELLAESVALVTYCSVRHGKDSEVKSLRSSLWVHREARWQMFFHQGTRASVESSPVAGE